MRLTRALVTLLYDWISDDYLCRVTLNKQQVYMGRYPISTAVANAGFSKRGGGGGGRKFENNEDEEVKFLHSESVQFLAQN